MTGKLFLCAFVAANTDRGVLGIIYVLLEFLPNV
jgi:hypothetical protein